MEEVPLLDLALMDESFFLLFLERGSFWKIPAQARENSPAEIFLICLDAWKSGGNLLRSYCISPQQRKSIGLIFGETSNLHRSHKGSGVTKLTHISEKSRAQKRKTLRGENFVRFLKFLRTWLVFESVSRLQCISLVWLESKAEGAIPLTYMHGLDCFHGATDQPPIKLKQHFEGISKGEDIAQSLKGRSVEFALDLQKVPRVETCTSQTTALQRLEANLPLFQS
ncbi:hypothetical protein VNO77_03303 [Canavalia gladiata]|uniref:Uncharacterized protein n=1 Tax=Canavalia gladiata TaxID=3824 RepID=A0AAN9MUH2_CANGL